MAAKFAILECSETDYQYSNSENADLDSPRPKRGCLLGNAADQDPDLASYSEKNCSSSDEGIDPVFPSGNCDHTDASSLYATFPSDDVSDNSTRPSEELATATVTRNEEGKYNDEWDHVVRILESKCCGKQCLHHLTVQNVFLVRKKYFSLGATAQQRQWLMDSIQENSSETEPGKLETKSISLLAESYVSMLRAKCTWLLRSKSPVC